MPRLTSQPSSSGALWTPTRRYDPRVGSTAVAPWVARKHRTADGWAISIRGEEVATMRDLNPEVQGSGGTKEYAVTYRGIFYGRTTSFEGNVLGISNMWIEDRFGWVADRAVSQTYLWYPDQGSAPVDKLQPIQIYEAALQHVCNVLTESPGDGITLSVEQMHARQERDTERMVLLRPTPELVRINAVTEALLSTPTLALTAAEVAEALGTAST